MDPWGFLDPGSGCGTLCQPSLEQRLCACHPLLLSPSWRLHFLSCDAYSSARFEHKSGQAEVEIQEVAAEGRSKMEESVCDRDKDYQDESMQGKERLKIRLSSSSV